MTDDLEQNQALYCTPPIFSVFNQRQHLNVTFRISVRDLLLFYVCFVSAFETGFCHAAQAAL